MENFIYNYPIHVCFGENTVQKSSKVDRKNNRWFLRYYSAPTYTKVQEGAAQAKPEEDSET